jgi:hypothetical protein
MSGIEPAPESHSRRAQIKAWRASDLDQMGLCWKSLFPEFADPPRTDPVRRFQDIDLRPQEAGWLFEHWVCEAFRLAGGEAILVNESVKVPSLNKEKVLEEIDGLAILGWQGFLIQCKLESQPTPFDPIARLHLQVERRPRGMLGLFFSRDYSDSAIELARELRPIRVLLLRVDEIALELKAPEPFDMLGLVRKKWLKAIMYAIPDFDLKVMRD